MVVTLLIPRIWGQTPIASATVNFPWHFAWHVGPVVFDADDLVAVIVSVGCLAAVSLWFTRTDVGLAVQAVGDRRDRASMLGIPVGRLQSVTWVVAGVLSFVSIFFQAAILGLPLDPTYGLTALVTALAALALGNFTELPVIAASAVALGILEQGVSWDDPTNPALGLAVLAGVVFAAIVVRQLLANRTDREVESSLALAGSVRDLRRRCATSPRCASGRRWRRWWRSPQPARCPSGWARASSSAARSSSCWRSWGARSSSSRDGPARSAWARCPLPPWAPPSAPSRCSTGTGT